MPEQIEQIEVEQLKEIKHTRSFMHDGVKWFAITTTCGEQYECEPQGQRWYCEGHCDTLKNIKAKICSGEINLGYEDEEFEEVRLDEPMGTWDCVHPCALLIAYSVEMTDTVMETLDKYGWLDENGEPDIRRANKEMELV